MPYCVWAKKKNDKNVDIIKSMNLGRKKIQKYQNIEAWLEGAYEGTNVEFITSGVTWNK